jgi:hypothetical protein
MIGTPAFGINATEHTNKCEDGMYKKILFSFLLATTVTIIGPVLATKAAWGADDAISKPYHFKANTPASADEINANFDILFEKINELSAKLAEASTGDVAIVLPQEGLVAHYTMNGNANDESTGANHGTAQGGAPTADRFGKADQALFLNGGAEKIELPSSVISGTTHSINLWAKTTDAAFGLLSGASSASDNALLVWYEPNGTFLVTIHGVDHFTSKVVNDGLWHMITLLITPDQTKIIIDGAHITDIPGSGAGFNIGALWVGAEQDCLNGCFDNNQSFDGSIDDLLVYDRILTQDEVDGLYAGFDPKAAN